MAFSYYNYTGDGTTTQYPVAFPYIRREHVLAAVAGSPATFTFVNSSTIQMDVAPANGATVRVYRQTPLTAPLVDFADGATLVAADLDTNAKQSIYTQQELSDSQEEGLANVIPNGDKGDITTSVGGTIWTVDTGAVTEAKIASGAVTEAKIGSGAVIEAKIGTGAVAEAKIGAGAITETKVGAGAITETKVGAGAITTAKLASVIAPVVSSLNGGPLAGMRNAIINGNPTINQRVYVSGTATTVANQYTLDRWRVVTSGQNISFTNSANVRTVTAPAGGCEQVVEGLSIVSGTYTLNWTGTATATVDGTAVAKGGNVTLTGGTDATVKFSSGTFAQVQLEPGPVATPFEQRPIGTELALCQRYYEVVNYWPMGITYTPNGDTRGYVSFAVQKRAAPTISGFPHSISVIAFTFLGEGVNLNGTIESASSSVNGFRPNNMGNSANISASAGGGHVMAWGDSGFRTVFASAEL